MHLHDLPEGGLMTLVDLTLRRLLGYEIKSQQWVRQAPIVLRIEEWGLLSVRRDRTSEVETVGSGSVAVFRNVRLGESYSITGVAQDKTTYGRLVFRHTGEDQHLRLLPGTRVVAQLVSDGGMVPTELDTLRIQVPVKDQPGANAWSQEYRDYPVQDGKLAISIPNQVSGNPAVPYPHPDTIHLLFTVKGHEPLEFKDLLLVPGTVDLGLITILERKPEFDVSVGGQILAKQIKQVLFVTNIVYSVEYTSPLPSGNTGIYVERASSHAENAGYSGWKSNGERCTVRLPDAPEVLVLRAGDESSYGAELVADGTYRIVPSAAYEFDLRIGELAEEFNIGFEWRGVRCSLGRLRPRHSLTTEPASFLAPEEGIQLWWRSVSGGKPTYTPLTSTTEIIRIPD